jgi:hypothetical protein
MEGFYGYAIRREKDGVICAGLAGGCEARSKELSAGK